MNIYDVAKQAGVSPATVSRVLNGNTNVKQTTRDKVMAVIEGANYVPNMMARNLSVGESKTIAFIVPDIENPFFSKALHGITDKAMERDYNVFMYGTDEDSQREHKVLASLNAEMIKGLIITPVSEVDEVTREQLMQFEERGVPVVLLDRDIPGSDLDGVFSEDKSGVCNAMDVLVEEGHEKIAIITGPVTSRPGRERLAGYRKGLKQHGLEAWPGYIVDGKFRVEDSYHAMQQLMANKEPPTAIIASNNLTTLGCLKYMKEAGLRLGHDISLIGFDDIPELAYTDTPFTAITRPVYEMGCETMRLLERRFQQKDVDDESPEIIHRNLVRTRLVKRGSEKLAPAKGKEEEINE